MSTFDHSHIEHAVDSLRSEGRDQHLDREPESGHSHKSSRSRHSNRRHWFFGEESVLQALKVLEGLGATWEEVSLPHSKYALATYYLLSSSEASANLARFDGIRYGYRTDNADNLIDLYKNTRSEGFGDEVKRRIMLGTFALSSGYYDAYYKKAQKVRTLIKKDFEEHDVKEYVNIYEIKNR